MINVFLMSVTGKRYEPEPYVPPPTIQSPVPPANSPSKGRKDKGKGTVTPEPREVPVSGLGVLYSNVQAP